MQDKVYHDSPYAVLWYTDTLEAYRSDRFEGFNAVPAGGGSLLVHVRARAVGQPVTVGPIGAAGGTPPPVPVNGAAGAVRRSLGTR